MPHRNLSRWERILYLAIFALALFSRFYSLGDRAISHDESLHAKFAWNLYAGRGFRHDPVMHGPLLFEGTALSFFLFGVSDFSARIFAALAGVALVMAPLLFRKWLRPEGSLAASVMLLISPSILYYSRYIRHDVLLMLTAVLLLWAIFQYLHEGRSRQLYRLAAFFSLMYATKEASYLYTAIFLALLAAPFAWQIAHMRWMRPRVAPFFVGLLVLVIVLGAAFVLSLRGATVEEQTSDAAANARMVTAAIPWWGRVSVALALLAPVGGLVLLCYGVGEEAIRQARLFDVLMVMGTLTLPLGSAFLMAFVAGLDMDAVYQAAQTGIYNALSPMSLAAMFAILGATLLGSVALGLWWDKRRWPIVALIHYGIFLILYTTFFTWSYGAVSGLVSSLAYWMTQQGVQRGGQPWYYYLLIGPLYEYFAIAFAGGTGIGVVVHLFKPRVKSAEGDLASGPPSIDADRAFPAFLLGWALLSWAAYTFAGEKMPWLVVHIALPNVFLAAWGLGRLASGMPWRESLARGWLLLISLPLAAAALAVLAVGGIELVAAWRGGAPEAGPSPAQLQSLSKVAGALIGSALFGGLLVRSLRGLAAGFVARLTLAAPAVFLLVLTVRTAVMANFINDDLAREFLVYAHGTPDIKVALQQVEEISWRATGDPHGIKVAYGKQGAWPFHWYLAEYPNTYYYETAPDPEKLKACPVIIAGREQWDVVDPIVGDAYLRFEYKYLWWPIQDYFDLTWARVRSALTDPEMRAAVWDIVWRRDYRRYAEATEQDLTLSGWPARYRRDFRLYVRRDLAPAIWDTGYGIR